MGWCHLHSGKGFFSNYSSLEKSLKIHLKMCFMNAIDILVCACMLVYVWGACLCGEGRHFCNNQNEISR